MKRSALTALLAGAALIVACALTPAAETGRASADAARDGYLGSGNHHDTTAAVAP